MRLSAEALYALLPPIYRDRDATVNYPLRELIAVIAEQAQVVEENIEQLYDDQFIETCAEWVAPYIGELIGYRSLHSATARIASPRAAIANTIGHRRRLGTASVLGELARDATGWPAAAVEHVLLVATTQHMNHIRPAHHFAPDLRNWRGLENLSTAFDPFTRTADMRSIERADGRYGLSNVGIHLWRLDAQPRGTHAPALAAQLDARRYLFSPLGAPLPLFISPRPPNAAGHSTTWLDVPGRITRRALSVDLLGENGDPPLRALYGRDEQGRLKSFAITLGGVELPADDVRACHLGDDGGGWANMPAAGGPVAVDPELGRIALPPDRAGPVGVFYHQGFSAEIGGGEYARAADFAPSDPAHPLLSVPSAAYPTLQAAVAALPPTGGIIEIKANWLAPQALAITAADGAAIEIRAADEYFPHLPLTAPLTIAGGANASVTIDGLMISGAPLTVPAANNGLEQLTLRHCTLVPGLGLDAVGNPAQPGAPSLSIERPGISVKLHATISGSIRAARDTSVSIEDSIIDAAAAATADSAASVAFAALDGHDFGGALSSVSSTLLGKVAAERFDFVSNSLLVAVAGDGWTIPVHVERRQVGCVRFSYVPANAIVPRRYRCQPQLAADAAIAARETSLGIALTTAQRKAVRTREAIRLVATFSAQRFGRPAYMQLRASVPQEIRAGAGDESEMGAFHLLYTPQRLSNLRIRLEEYLRVSLEAGAFLDS